MSHRATVVAVYKINDAELVHVSVTVGASYPDAVSEAKATAVAGLTDILDDIYARERVAIQADE